MLSEELHNGDDLSRLLSELQLSEEIPNEPIEPTTQTKWAKQDSSDPDEELKLRFLNPSNVLPWDLLDLIQDIPEQEPKEFYDALLTVPKSISRSSYRLKRKGIEGKVHKYVEEINVSDLQQSNASTSLSINRKIYFQGNCN